MSTDIIPSTTLAMSTREIAELTGKPHADVLKKVRKQLKELGIGEGKFSSSYTTQQGKQATEYLLDHIQTMNLITGYSVKLRDKVNRRWLELEKKAAEHNWIETRETLKEVWWETQEAVKLYYGEPRSFDYANEQNLIYKVIFGCTAKRFKLDRGLGREESAKDGMTEGELETVAALEAANALFLTSRMDRPTRELALRNLMTSRLKKLR